MNWLWMEVWVQKPVIDRGRGFLEPALEWGWGTGTGFRQG